MGNNVAAAAKKTNGKRTEDRSSRFGKGNPGGFFKKLGGSVDLLAEFEYVLANPDEDHRKHPIRKEINALFRKDLPEFTRQYNELLKSKRGVGNGGPACSPAKVANEGGGPPGEGAQASLSEEEVRIEEAIDRVVEELTQARKKVETGSG